MASEVVACEQCGESRGGGGKWKSDRTVEKGCSECGCGGGGEKMGVSGGADNVSEGWREGAVVGRFQACW